MNKVELGGGGGREIGKWTADSRNTKESNLGGILVKSISPPPHTHTTLGGRREMSMFFFVFFSEPLPT